MSFSAASEVRGWHSSIRVQVYAIAGFSSASKVVP
jgi:hypothetical protein